MNGRFKLLDDLRREPDFRPGFFTPELRSALLADGLDSISVDRIEALCWLRRFDRDQGHALQRRSTARRLRASGVNLPPGKRPAAGLECFVDEVGRLIEQMGVPFASGEGSVMTRILRAIAADTSIGGDPRDQLRAEARRRKRSAAAAFEKVHSALADGFTPSSLSSPK